MRRKWENLEQGMEIQVKKIKKSMKSYRCLGRLLIVSLLLHLFSP